MGTLLALLVFLGVAVAAIAVGTRISLYFYSQNALGTHSMTTDTTQTFPVERNIVQRAGQLRYEESDAISARYAWSGLAVIAAIVLLTVMAVISLMGGVIH